MLSKIQVYLPQSQGLRHCHYQALSKCSHERHSIIGRWEQKHPHVIDGLQHATREHFPWASMLECNSQTTEIKWTHRVKFYISHSAFQNVLRHKFAPALCFCTMDTSENTCSFLSKAAAAIFDRSPTATCWRASATLRQLTRSL